MRSSFIAAALAGLAAAQRPSGTSICDYYTKALLGNTSAANEYTVLTLLVNTAVVGSSVKKPTLPGVTFPTNVTVTGIVNKGQYGGKDVNLLPFFSGALASSNRGGSSGVAVNFLDDGGATPLINGKPANGTTSNQYMLLTHLYQFFGALLGCSSYGMGAFPAYQGKTSLGDVHKFMDLSETEFAYFISQVGAAAASFGVASADITDVATALNNTFGLRCAAPIAVLPKAPKEIQAICVDSSCPLSPNNSCSAYGKISEPSAASSGAAKASGSTVASSTGSSAAGKSTGSSTGSAASPSSTKKSSAVTNVAGVFTVVGLSVLAFFL